MLLFTKLSADAILNDGKWQTRRCWLTQRVKVGSVHLARTRMLDSNSTFAKLRILRVWEWDGLTISDEDAIAEGFETPQEFLSVYWDMNTKKYEKEPHRKHYAIEFEVIEKYEDYDNGRGAETSRRYN